MAKKIILYFFTLMLCLEASLHLLGWGLRFYNDYQNQSEQLVSSSKKIYKIMVIGESTSYGFLLKNRTVEAYPYQLPKLLSEKIENVDFKIINLSYPSQTTDSILNYFEKNFLTMKPNLVICHFGNNDTSQVLNPFLKMRLFGFVIPSFVRKIKIIKLAMLNYLFFKEKENISVGKNGDFLFQNREFRGPRNVNLYKDNTRRNYQDILNLIKKHNTPYLMLSYFNTFELTFGILSDLQKANKAHYINLRLEGKKGDAELFAEDKWHPNLKGHTLIAKKITDLMTSNRDYFFK